MLYYTLSTTFAISVGLLLVNLFHPGKYLDIGAGLAALGTGLSARPHCRACDWCPHDGERGTDAVAEGAGDVAGQGDAPLPAAGRDLRDVVLVEVLGERLVSRIKNAIFAHISFTGQDYRPTLRKEYFKSNP